jgi:hypothetical protein
MGRLKRQIGLRNFINDIRRGLTRIDLTDKYGLTSRELHRAFGKLVEVGAVAVSELPEKLPSQYVTLAQDNIRDLFRQEIDFELPVYEATEPDVFGKIRDITLEGVGLTGVKARVGEVKRFVALGDYFGAVGPFEFEAKCRWFKRGTSERGYFSGFQITDISEEDIRELRKLIRVISIGG